MRQTKLFIFLYIFICAVLFSSKMSAQAFSYVYIQGDKETPFYVKLEGEMQPRFGKNYCIISRLAPGPMNIQILFEQNKYPAQKFAFYVPENGSRAFLLTHNGGVFFLYDLQQRYYLVAGNKLSADHPKDAPNPYLAAANKETASATPFSNDNIKNDTPQNTVKENVPVDKSVNETGDQPAFINNIVLNNDKVKTGKDDIVNIPEDENTQPTGIINSDCPHPMSENDFDELYMNMMQQSAGDRLSLLLDHLKTCYSTEQVRLLAYNLSDDTERFTFLKQVYPHVSDQSNYYMLEHLFNTDEGKNAFQHLVNQ